MGPQQISTVRPRRAKPGGRHNLHRNLETTPPQPSAGSSPYSAQPKPTLCPSTVSHAKVDFMSHVTALGGPSSADPGCSCTLRSEPLLTVIRPNPKWLGCPLLRNMRRGPREVAPPTPPRGPAWDWLWWPGLSHCPGFGLGCLVILSVVRVILQGVCHQ